MEHEKRGARIRMTGTMLGRTPSFMLGNFPSILRAMSHSGFQARRQIVS